MSLMYSQMIPLGTPCPEFDLPGTDGRNYSNSTLQASSVLVCIVMCNHCPYVQAQWDRLVELDRAYRGRGVQVIAINSNDAEAYPEDSFERMKHYAKKYRMEFPYLRDETQRVARAFGAVCTPDLFIYGNDRCLAYRGRLDDSWSDASRIGSRDAEQAIEALLNGAKPAADQYPSEGCSIKWKRYTT